MRCGASHHTEIKRNDRLASISTFSNQLNYPSVFCRFRHPVFTTDTSFLKVKSQFFDQFVFPWKRHLPFKPTNVPYLSFPSGFLTNFLDS